MQVEEVVALARARPWADQAWASDLLASFPDTLARAIEAWGLRIDRAHLEGAGLPVLQVCRSSPPTITSPSGSTGGSTGGWGAAVLKFDGAGTDLSQQVRVLQAADGRGYARVLDADLDLGVALLEPLGPPLAQTTPDPLEQAVTLADLLLRAWELPIQVGSPTGPSDKAASLLELLEGELAAKGGLRHTGTVERAATVARDLAGSPSDRQVVVHGDPHSLNALVRDTATEEHVFIDPDGFVGEPEYDLGVALRDHQREIDRLDASQGAGAGRRWHADLVRRVSARLELDADRVDAWAFVERVTTGVWLRRLGYTEESDAWLATAQRM
ncbi:aminoglycoside phosphotransferase family protein [Ornithinimicrobium sp. Y1694]|uniref:aminoglycoside phosphotransferase family protein n=1 Tax=Ornithinimicrobium sp. Y1694 TaxID=3418590 RepID=UPI003CF0A801